MRTAALFLLAGTAFAAPVPKDFKKAGDDALIVGTWKPSGSGGPTAWFRFDADGKMRTWHVPEIGPPIEWKFTIDPTAAPKRATLSHANGSTSYDCVYELTADTLKIGFIVNKGKGVPEKLEPHPAIQLYSMTRATDGK